MTYTDFLINNTSAQSRAKSAEIRKVLIAIVFEKIGYRAPKCLSMKELKNILDQ